MKGRKKQDIWLWKHGMEIWIGKYIKKLRAKEKKEKNVKLEDE